MPTKKPTHILVPTDFSVTAQAALEYAILLCELTGARTTLVHVTNRAKLEESLMGFDSIGYLTQVMNTPGSPTAYTPSLVEWDRMKELALKEMKSAVEKACPDKVEIRYSALEGYPSETIVKFARDNKVDLIVMGTQGRGRVAQFFMGSVTQNVIRMSECPVLAVKPPIAPDSKPQTSPSGS